MKKKLIFIFLIFIALPNFAQKWKLTRYEASIGIGTANYFGDIGGSADKNNWFGLKDVSILSTRPSLSLGARYKTAQNVAIKLNLNFVMLSGSDQGSINAKRNYSFNSYGFEHSLQVEYYFITDEKRNTSFARFNRRGMLNNYSHIGVYVFGAAGGNFIKPVFKGNINPAFEYTKSSVYAPILLLGLGAKLILSNYYALSAEFGPRYAFSDYIDGFSTKFSHFNDVYYFGSFSLIYRIKTSRKGYPILFRDY